MCQACRAMTDLILAGATSAGALADFVIQQSASARQSVEPAPTAKGEQDGSAQNRAAH